MGFRYWEDGVDNDGSLHPEILIAYILIHNFKQFFKVQSCIVYVILEFLDVMFFRENWCTGTRKIEYDGSEELLLKQLSLDTCDLSIKLS